ncbi:MAG TPA: MerR family transcriptional regulator [Rhodanobacteraceae bacterium]|nr:MerR family transcriptional regulator [Rhodanobacteraceae bacterium]
MTYTMGGLATAVGVHVETIRYYQRRGLFAEPYRSTSGTRRYEEAHVRRLRFIKNAQALRFDLDEVADLLALEHDQDSRNGERVGARKLAIVRQHITHLCRIERALAAIVEQQPHGKQSKARCPLMEALAAADASNSGP